MKYIPVAENDRLALLNELGMKSVEELFEDIPSPLRCPDQLDYPKALSELELRNVFQDIAQMNKTVSQSFVGAGIYPHDIPSIVPYLQSRTEFQTSYTPYQPEVSQGTLQALFEFQTLACQLTETELSNATLYDGATSLGEALLMALRIRKKGSGKILISSAIHPFYLKVLQTYGQNFADRFEMLPTHDHRIDLSALEARLQSGEVEILITQSPNVFGSIEEYSRIGEWARSRDVFWISSTMEPVVFGLMKGPGAFGADIVTAEGQSFGNAPYLGGSTYGIFCTKNEYLRNLPGRLVGQTFDENGKRSFTLTFATREQFIRRGRATSNICTNNSLNMLAGLIHLVCLGREGIRELARLNFSRTEYLKALLSERGFEVMSAPSFNEFTVDLKVPAEKVIRAGMERNIVAGLDMKRLNPAWDHKLLLHVSELHSRQAIEELANLIQEEAS